MSVLARIRASEPHLGTALLFGFGLAAFSYWLQGDVGLLGIQDEGFLWYSVVETAHGAVPMRDFRAYDPGRYYWSAAWAQIFGDGILALRLSTAIFQGAGLTCGLLAASRVFKRWWALFLMGFCLIAWMYPPWKLYEPSIAMAAVYVAVLLIEKPTPRRHFLAGAFVGGAAFFGRNLGLYAAVGCAMIMAFLWWKAREPGFVRRGGAWSLGVLAGYSPMILMCLAVPGFFQALIDSVLFFAQQGTTNLPADAPLPWRVDYSKRQGFAVVTAFATGVAFLVPFAVYPPAIWLIVRAKREELTRAAVLIAAVFIGLPFMHHVGTRSDIFHLAQCIHPVLIACVALPLGMRIARTARVTGALLAGVLVLTWLVIVPRSSYAEKLTGEGPNLEHVQTKIGDDVLWMERGRAALIENLLSIIRAHVKPDEKIWLGPQCLVCYPILKRKSPTWDIYPCWPADKEKQMAMLAELADVDWALITDSRLGGIENRVFAVTHPMVARVLLRKFERIPTPALPPSYQLMHRREQ